MSQEPAPAPEEHPSAEDVVHLYERHARLFDRERDRSLVERTWLDRFLAHVPAGGTVLDVGCGMGEPIAGYLLEQGFEIVGTDSSPAMIERCRARFPGAKWHVGDMRGLAVGMRFHGIIAWDSFFHLRRDEQREMFSRFAAHALPGAALLFTTGPEDGEAIGTFGGEPLYHSSLAPEEYRALLARHGFDLRGHVVNDPECGDHAVWLATYHEAD